MERRYQVFISSTYDDLQEERRQIMQALLELDCIPSGMELFPAADEDQWSLIKRVIDDCDYYIVVSGGRYGSLNQQGAGFTEMEYDYAVSRGKPTIAFIHRNPGAIAVEKSDNTDEGRQKLDAFRKKLQQRLIKTWASPEELGSVVSRSLIQLIKQRPAVGWVRGDNLASEQAASDIVKLLRRVEDLETELLNGTHHRTRGNRDSRARR